MAPGPRSGEPRAPLVIELVEKYCQRHRAIENYNLAYHLLFRLLGRLGFAPNARSAGSFWAGLVHLLLVMAGSLAAPLAVTAVLGEWAIAPIGIWIGVSFGLGLLMVLAYGPLVRATDTFL